LVLNHFSLRKVSMDGKKGLGYYKMYENLDEMIVEISKGIKLKDENNLPEIVKTARKNARITCRKLGNVLNLKPSKIMDIERGRLEISEDAATALIMVCISKIVIQKEIV